MQRGQMSTVSGLQPKIRTRTSQTQRGENAIMLSLMLLDTVHIIYFFIFIKDFQFHY
jgi:hypothetical protein